MERLYSKGYGQGKSIFQKGWEAMNKEWIFYILTKRGENDEKMNAFLTLFNKNYVKVSSKVTNSFATKWLESYQKIYFKANCATSIQGLSTSIATIKYNIELNLLRYLHENQLPEWKYQDKTSRVKLFFIHKWDYQSKKG